MMHMIYHVTVLSNTIIILLNYFGGWGGGISPRNRPIHEPQQNIEKTTPTIIPIIYTIGMIDYTR